MNLMLIAHGYPPAIILKAQRKKYLNALQRVQSKKDYRPLAEFVARAVSENVNKLLLPFLSTETDLIPLAACGDHRI